MSYISNSEKLKDVVNKEIESFKKRFTLSHGESGFSSAASYCTTVPVENDGYYRFKMLEEEYILIPKYYPINRFAILKTYHKIQDIENDMQTKLQHIDILDIYIDMHGQACLVNEKYKRSIYDLQKEYLTELYTFMVEKEREFLQTIKSNINI